MQEETIKPALRDSALAESKQPSTAQSAANSTRGRQPLRMETIEASLVTERETIGLLARSLQRREEELDAKDYQVTALTLQLEQVMAEKDRMGVLVRELTRNLEDQAQRSNAPRERRRGNTRNCTCQKDNTHTPTPLDLQNAFERRIATLENENAVLIEKLSECHAQLVSCRERASSTFLSGMTHHLFKLSQAFVGIKSQAEEDMASHECVEQTRSAPEVVYTGRGLARP
ncbi:hypothetical protein DFP72DRAFT_1132942 [Ephemerocybe angulata]|uniref:Uncharacterized protein n=1 Tax=Ephemerocybe angulata TaxID=980116 RepID=A0A8H6HVJ2_9AGAR|nr:hypothetical protein DFP72DRAFT_1132942 [Tulosesus angulatus]